MTRIRPHCTLFFAAALAAFAQSAHVALSDRLRAWVGEIESLSGGKVILARIYTDPLRNQLQLPADADEPQVLARYLSDPGFRAQFTAAHALSLNYQGPEGRLHYVLLNMAFGDQWAAEGEEGLIGHELGHAWLNARGYRAPEYVPGPRACVASLAGDIVQHVLIRAEMDRRGIPFREFWVRQLEAENPESGAGPCRRLILLAQLVDARLGLGQARWEDLARLEEKVARSNPLIPPYAGAISEFLRGAELGSEAGFGRALEFVRRQLERLYDGLPAGSGLRSQLSENKEEISAPH